MPPSKSSFAIIYDERRWPSGDDQLKGPSALSASVHTAANSSFCRSGKSIRNWHVNGQSVEFAEAVRQKLRQSLPPSLGDRPKIRSNAGNGFELAPTSVEILENRLGVDVSEIMSYYRDMGIMATEGGDVHCGESSEHLDVVAPFRRQEVLLGPRLGSGEFSDVHEVRAFALKTDLHAAGRAPGKSEMRSFMKGSERYRDTGRARYALKSLREDYLAENGETAYVRAAGDLALEAELLANLSHPNIIKLRGLTDMGPHGFANGPSGYFLVIDRLYEILDERVMLWHGGIPEDNTSSSREKGSLFKKIKKKIKRYAYLALCNKSKVEAAALKGDELMEECLNVALQLSAALVYLHSHSIIFRDLKPANIGFDVRGDVKLFDFGLARVMPKNGDPYNDDFKLSWAGSPRYLPPECLASERYNMKADVYSFSLVLWEMLRGVPPYFYADGPMHLNHMVVVGGVRPKIDGGWPDGIADAMRGGFDADAARRPRMKDFHDTILWELRSLRGEDTKELTASLINWRRSAFSEFAASAAWSFTEDNDFDIAE